MNHNDFDFCEDLITPFYHFLKQMGMSTREPKSAYHQMNIPEKYFRIPKAYLQKSIKMGWGCCYVSVNNPSQHVNQSFQHAASSYFDDHDILIGEHPEIDRDHYIKDDADLDQDEFSVPITLEQMNEEMGPNHKMMKTRNSVVRQSKNNSTLKDHGGPTISGNIPHALSVDVLE